MKKIILIVTCMVIIVVSNNMTYADLNSGLTAYYSFDGNANDQSGNGNDGTVYGATLTAGKFGNAYSFDGVDDYIKASANNLPTAERTVSLWFYTDTVINNRPFPHLLGYGGGPCGTSWLMDITYTSFQMHSHCDANIFSSNYQTPPVGDWFNWVITTQNDGTKMYINGVEVASNSNFISNTYVDGKDLAIGGAVSGNGLAPYTDLWVNYFQGKIDDVRIYNRALSVTEIQELAVVPEPISSILFITGGIVLAGRRYIKQVSAVKSNHRTLFRHVIGLRSANRFIAF